MAIHIPPSRLHEWTEEDDTLLRANYREKDNDELSAMMGTDEDGNVRHTPSQVGGRMRVLLLSRRDSVESHRIAIESYARLGKTTEEVADLLGLKATSIRAWASKNGVRFGHSHCRSIKCSPHPAWTGEELNVLKREYGVTPFKVLAEKLGHSPAACRQQAYKMGLGVQGPKYIKHKKHFTEEEDTYIRRYASTMTWEQIAMHLGRETSSVANRAALLGVRSKNAIQAEYMEAHYIDILNMVVEGMSNEEIGKVLKVTEATVRNYLFRHNIKRERFVEGGGK